MNSNNQNAQNQMNNFNNIPNNTINQINIQNNLYYYPSMQANLNLMSNYQAEMWRMNHYTNMENLNNNLNSPQLYMPMTDSSFVEMLEKFFSVKNLNKDVNLRKNMDEETGNVPLEFILSLKKIQSMNMTQERIIQFINDVGSDRIELVDINNTYYLRPKNFEQVKTKLISIEELEEKKKQRNNQNVQQQNIQMGVPPMLYYPVPQMMYYNQMMMHAQPNMGNQQVMPNQSQENNEGNK